MVTKLPCEKKLRVEMKFFDATLNRIVQHYKQDQMRFTIKALDWFYLIFYFFLFTQTNMSSILGSGRVEELLRKKRA